MPIVFLHTTDFSLENSRKNAAQFLGTKQFDFTTSRPIELYSMLFF